MTAYFGKRMRRLIVWIVATGIVVAAVLTYQLNVAADEEEKEEPPPAACLADPALPGCPPPDAPEGE